MMVNANLNPDEETHEFVSSLSDCHMAGFTFIRTRGRQGSAEPTGFKGPCHDVWKTAKELPMANKFQTCLLVLNLLMMRPLMAL